MAGTKKKRPTVKLTEEQKRSETRSAEMRLSGERSE